MSGSVQLHDYPGDIVRLSSTNKPAPEANYPETLLNREFSHQILVLAETVGGKTLDKATGFHDKPVF
jgi:hypothetical protein